MLILSVGIGCLLVVLLLLWAFKAGRQRANAAMPTPAPVPGAPRAVPRPEVPAAPPPAAPVRAVARAPERVVPAPLHGGYDVPDGCRVLTVEAFLQEMKRRFPR